MAALRLALTLSLGALCTLCLAQDFAWLTSVDQANTLARQGGRPVMLYFTTEWCGWCKVMEKNTFSDPAVIKESSAYVSVKLDAQKEGKQLAAKYKVSAYPTFVFINPEGSEKGRIVGYTEPAPFQQKVSAILTGSAGRKSIEEALAKNPKDGAALCQMGNLHVVAGKLVEAEKCANEALAAGCKSSDLAALFSQIGFETGMSNPPAAVQLYEKALGLKDKNTTSLTFERLMTLAAMGGNKSLMEATAKRMMSEPNVNPDLARRAERVVKGGEQEKKLLSPQALVAEMKVQLQAKADGERDTFFVRNLFLEGAALTVISKFGDQPGRLVVDVDSLIQNLGIDKLKTAWSFEPETITTSGSMAIGSVAYTTSSKNAEGKVFEAEGTAMFILCQQGSRWFIQSLCLETKTKKS